MGVFSEMDLDIKQTNIDNGPADEETGQLGGEERRSASLKQCAQQLRSNAEPAEVLPPKTDDQADDLEARRKAHEEVEAKRKAEWDANQAAKSAAEQEQLQRISAMSDDEIMMASIKRIGADTERLTRRNMKECVTEQIQTRCLEDPAFARKAMHPRKSMVHCFQYISRMAWDYVQDELKANGIQPRTGNQGYGCDIPDDLCYKWAEDYFNAPDVKEAQKQEEEFVPRPFYGGKSTPKKKKQQPAKKEKKPQMPEPLDGQLTFDTEPLERAG